MNLRKYSRMRMMNRERMRKQISKTESIREILEYFGLEKEFETLFGRWFQSYARPVVPLVPAHL